jgi:hypothetical protein
MTNATPTPELANFCEEYGVEEATIEFNDDGNITFDLMPEPDGDFDEERFVGLLKDAFICLNDKEEVSFVI